jgi:hypothetical protein
MMPTDPADWIRRCADRFQEQWPRADREILEDTAMDLLGIEKWRRLSPEVAAVAWLRQGCGRRCKSEPPRRSNIEPGVEADVEVVGCG